MTTPPPPPPPGWQPPPPPSEWQPPQQPYLPPPPTVPPSFSADPFPTQSAYPPPPGAWETLSNTAPEPVRPRSKGRLVASIVAVAALVGGGVATYVAVSDSNSHGASSPREAIQTIVDDLNKSDLLGVLDDLAPAERTAIATPFTDAVNELKRTKVLSGSADPSSVTGVQVQIKALTFSDATITINDHVQIVQLTGGTVRLTTDAARVPFTKEFLDAAFPNGAPTGGSDQTIDIAKQNETNSDNRLVQIAAQKVDGKWYPSLFYTIANAVVTGPPTADDYVAPHGAASPDLVVRKLFEDVQQGKWRDLVALLSPDELGVLHDYGGLLLRSLPEGNPLPFTVKDFEVDVTNASGGGKRVALTEITVGVDGKDVTVKQDGDCFEVTTDGETKRMCTGDLVDQVVAALEGFGITSEVTPAQRTAFEDLLKGLTSVSGLIVTESDGQWYLNPVRSVLSVIPSVLSHLSGQDVLEFIKLIQGD